MKSAFIRYIIITTCVLCIQRTSFSQNSPVSYLGIEQGLSNNAVRCIFQDHFGFMWFGTYDGLNRYDGYGFKVFRNRFNDPTSLVNNWITAITEDKDFNLWIGTRQGISVYNPLLSDLATVQYFPYQQNKSIPLTSQILSMAIDKEGQLFVGSEHQGFFIRDKQAYTLRQLPLDTNGTTRYSVGAIEVDQKERVWLFVDSYGLCMYDRASGTLKLINDDFKYANCMEFDGTDQLWVGTVTGTHLYSISSNKYILNIDESNGLKDNRVVNLSLDKSHHLWMATDGGGLNIFNIATHEFTYLNQGNDKNSLTSEAVYSVFEDKEGRKWIGTLRGGINIIDPSKKRFQTIVHDPVQGNGLIGNFILSFCEDTDGKLWIGTDGAGLSVWDRKNNSFVNYQRNGSNPSKLNGNFITQIIKDDRNEIWISTYGGGVSRFNKTKNTFEKFPLIDPGDNFEDANVFRLYKDRQQNIWAGCVGAGFYRFNRDNNRFELFDASVRNVVAVGEDHLGNLWVGDFERLVRVSKTDKKHFVIPVGQPVRAIYEDRFNNFWLGTEGGGLLLLDKQTNKFTRYTDVDGLCNNSVLNILEDEEGNLWLTTFNGISKFNIKSKTFKNFYQNDGLQSNQFNYNAALRLQSGEFVAGGIKGFNLFYPQQVGSFNYKPQLVLAGFRVTNRPVDKYAQYVVEADADKISKVRIPFSRAVLSFDFAALEYSAPDKILYAYYLEGWDKDWNYTGNIRTANYSSLTEGGYKLWIKSTDSDGNWQEKQLALDITILPPWYRSRLAYILYVLFAGGIIYAYIYFKSRQDKLRYELKLTQVNAEKDSLKNKAEQSKLQYELDVSKLNAEKEKEINEKRVSFFTNISHEFRTPLTLIINPVKDLLKKTEEPDDSKELKIVHRNARRLLSLVDQLLLFRKADVEADRMKFSPQNFCQLCHEVYLCFVQQAKMNKQEFLFECEYDQLELFVDKEKMEIALYNLLSNAIKFTPPGGKIVFSISDLGEEVEVAVTDNGPGIPEDAKQKLFDKFYQATAVNAPKKPGFGIGLYLVKHFIEGHRGEVYFDSEEGKGTTFYMKLKKGKAHLDNQSIINQPLQESGILEELVETPAEEDTPRQSGETILDEMVTTRQTVLVADDNKDIRQYLQQILKDRYDVLEAVNGSEALNLAQQQFPDLIISDIRMDVMDGIELCKQVKADPSTNHIPVLLLTGSYGSEIELQSLEGGADGYITKPFDKDILLAKVDNLFKSRSELQKYFLNEITLKKNPLKISPEYREFLDKCIAIVESHLDDEQFSIKVLAKEIGMSHSNLYKKVRTISGQSVTGFIRYIRLRKAAELMIKHDCNVNQAAFQVGISDIKYFRTHFNKLFGLNPSEYIKKYRQSFNEDFQLNRNVLKDKK
jgi:signal transduction histidine kinase/ligand-binding sensor domain-containing protein/DNA-binding response OmpR family regulator